MFFRLLNVASNWLDDHTGNPHDSYWLWESIPRLITATGSRQRALSLLGFAGRRHAAFKHDTFFRQHPVFSGDELAGHLARIGSHGARTQERVLAYHTKAGRPGGCVGCDRGCMRSSLPASTGDTYPVDPYQVAARLTPDAVLSHHTALEFHGQAHSVWHHFAYSAERPAETLTFRDQVFRGTKFPLALVRSGAEYRGVLTTERFGMPLRVASLERTLN